MRLRYADLRTRKAQAASIGHHLVHPLDQGLDLVVKLLDLLGPLPKHPVAVSNYLVRFHSHILPNAEAIKFSYQLAGSNRAVTDD